MPRYRNIENGNELDATEEFASVALPAALYEKVADETADERELRELREAIEAKVNIEDDDAPVGRHGEGESA